MLGFVEETVLLQLDDRHGKLRWGQPSARFILCLGPLGWAKLPGNPPE
jgi:hypothetical protein